ncbi:GH12 family glycosyl hydrolase domain-containing protein [Streptomyces sp. CA-132043]|uniref:GH12 family glycosyl hydrolase domain-containing protein n=1 Tax=Streptomyces sp. CA-132043 TaxID=3240048 RepID=UPI003D9169E8
MAALCTPVAMAGPAHAATELCQPFDSLSVDGGRYIVQNNVWGASTPQCLSVDGTSFTVTRAEHNNATNGAPASYPSIYAGCHYGNCTTGSGLPRRLDQLNEAVSSWSTSSPDAGVYDVAYDLWFDPNPNPTGQNAGELMIWNKFRGAVQPVGTKVASGVSVAGTTYDVWAGNIGWNVISYVRTSATDAVTSLDLRAFARDAAARGSLDASWYLTSVQAGFEPWQGGQGLRTNSFSLNVR